MSPGGTSFLGRDQRSNLVDKGERPQPRGIHESLRVQLGLGGNYNCHDFGATVLVRVIAVEVKEHVHEHMELESVFACACDSTSGEASMVVLARSLVGEAR